MIVYLESEVEEQSRLRLIDVRYDNMTRWVEGAVLCCAALRVVIAFTTLRPCHGRGVEKPVPSKMLCPARRQNLTFCFSYRTGI